MRDKLQLFAAFLLGVAATASADFTFEGVPCDDDKKVMKIHGNQYKCMPCHTDELLPDSYPVKRGPQCESIPREQIGDTVMTFYFSCKGENDCFNGHKCVACGHDKACLPCHDSEDVCTSGKMATVLRRGGRCGKQHMLAFQPILEIPGLTPGASLHPHIPELSSSAPPRMAKPSQTPVLELEEAEVYSVLTV